MLQYNDNFIIILQVNNVLQNEATFFTYIGKLTSNKEFVWFMKLRQLLLLFFDRRENEFNFENIKAISFLLLLHFV